MLRLTVAIIGTVGDIMAANIDYDIIVIGGGINGVGIARDAAGRGLKVLLCDKGDLGGATSSASSKLIHGGLRYLENLEILMVRKALAEREVLLRAAPHVIWPLRFVLPYRRGLRPAWMLRLGLFLYDNIGGRELLPASRSVDLRHEATGAPLKDSLVTGFEYSDCWADDARLVVLNAIDAANRSAEILPRTECHSARRSPDRWTVDLAPAGGGKKRTVTCRALVNATGPWVSDVLHETLGIADAPSLKRVKGSHLVVPKLFDGDHAYLLQNTDKRIVFAIPYEGDYTLIGTTEVEVDDDPSAAAVSKAETDYLCRLISLYFRQGITPKDVVWSYAGVRPLYDDGRRNASAVTRDYVFDLKTEDGGAPLLSVFGGKLTTYRRLADHALEKLLPHIGGPRAAWTAHAPLPGGDMPNADFDSFLAGLKQAHAWIPEPLLTRYARGYGTLADTLIDGARSLKDLGQDFGGGLYEAEVDYLRREEWAHTADDILWRRTKLGLHVPKTTKPRLEKYL